MKNKIEDCLEEIKSDALIKVFKRYIIDIISKGDTSKPLSNSDLEDIETYTSYISHITNLIKSKYSIISYTEANHEQTEISKERL